MLCCPAEAQLKSKTTNILELLARTFPQKVALATLVDSQSGSSQLFLCHCVSVWVTFFKDEVNISVCFAPLFSFLLLLPSALSATTSIVLVSGHFQVIAAGRDIGCNQPDLLHRLRRLSGTLLKIPPPFRSAHITGRQNVLPHILSLPVQTSMVPFACLFVWSCSETVCIRSLTSRFQEFHTKCFMFLLVFRWTWNRKGRFTSIFLSLDPLSTVRPPVRAAKMILALFVFNIWAERFSRMACLNKKQSQLL